MLKLKTSYLSYFEMRLEPLVDHGEDLAGLLLALLQPRPLPLYLALPVPRHGAVLVDELLQVLGTGHLLDGGGQLVVVLAQHGLVLVNPRSRGEGKRRSRSFVRRRRQNDRTANHGRPEHGRGSEVPVVGGGLVLRRGLDGGGGDHAGLGGAGAGLHLVLDPDRRHHGPGLAAAGPDPQEVRPLGGGRVLHNPELVQHLPVALLVAQLFAEFEG